MKCVTALIHEFVGHIPQSIEQGNLYVSIPFATVVHKCCCGCGNEVVTPLSPTDWTLIFDGESVSLDPSIGNWGFKCQAHYWIRRNRVEWARRWSRQEIEAGREGDRRAKQRYFAPTAKNRESEVRASQEGQSKGVRRTLHEWWSARRR